MSDVRVMPAAVPHEVILKLALKELKQMRSYQEELAEENQSRARKGRDRAPHCKHGTYIGDSYGADYLCWACESGESDHSIALGVAHSRVTRIQERIGSHMRTINIYVEAMAKSSDDVERLLIGAKAIAREARDIRVLQKELEQ